MKNVFTFLLLLFSLLCNGQSPKLFTTDKELSSSLINQIYQDRNGFIWIATEDGLNRYDGAKFTIYKHEPNNCLLYTSPSPRDLSIRRQRQMCIRDSMSPIMNIR